MFVVFDLDGTLADGAHREHHIAGPTGTRDWDAYFGACADDKPHSAYLELAATLHEAGHRVEIWTGRRGETEPETRAWLVANGVGTLPLRMRPPRDYTHDTELKAAWLAAEPTPPDLVFEDRARVVQMWRAAGVPCAQVAPGDF